MIGDVFDLRIADVDDAEILAETVRLGFASFRSWAGPAFDPPPGTLEADRIREGLARPSTWALLALAGDEPAGHVAITQARERAEPRPDIPGLAHFWMLFVRQPWWAAGSRCASTASRCRRPGGAAIRRCASIRPPATRAAAPSTSARAGTRPGRRSPNPCSAWTSWNTAAICEDLQPCSDAAGQPTRRPSPIARSR